MDHQGNMESLSSSKVTVFRCIEACPYLCVHSLVVKLTKVL